MFSHVNETVTCVCVSIPDKRKVSEWKEDELSLPPFAIRCKSENLDGNGRTVLQCGSNWIWMTVNCREWAIPPTRLRVDVVWMFVSVLWRTWTRSQKCKHVPGTFQWHWDKSAYGSANLVRHIRVYVVKCISGYFHTAHHCKYYFPNSQNVKHWSLSESLISDDNFHGISNPWQLIVKLMLSIPNCAPNLWQKSELTENWKPHRDSQFWHNHKHFRGAPVGQANIELTNQSLWDCILSLVHPYFCLFAFYPSKCCFDKSICLV